MKMIFTLCMFVLLFCCRDSNAQEWVAMQPTPPVVYTQPFPTQSYSTFPVIQYVKPAVYQAVPTIINRPVVVEQYGILCKRSYVINIPQIQWTYQLVFINP